MRKKKRLLSVTALALAMSLLAGGAAQAASDTPDADETAQETSSAIEAQEAEYGFYVDVNITDEETGEGLTTEVVLTTFLELWSPGDEWYNGTKLNADVLNQNITTAYAIAAARSEEDEVAAYEDEVYHQSYSIMSGLGELEASFRLLAGIGEDSSSWEYDEDAVLSSVAELMTTFRNSNASTNNPKAYYQYPRPYRWNVETGEVVTDTIITYQVVASIIDYKSLATYDEDGNIVSIKDGSSDGGFPSGHTNGAYISALALAIAVPEYYSELVMRAADLGNNRIVAGMHSPLDVMGGRMAATAVAAAAAYRESNSELIEEAYEAVHEYLITENTIEIADASTYTEYQENLELYLYYMTYGFEQINDTDVEMTVPKGAEALLETRYPYLEGDDIRWILYTTGLESGYPLLDDDEGWGRLNLYAAANGYGAFVEDVYVNMDADEGSYSAVDNWLNDISGEGSLTKDGSGTLVLAGNNTYEGGTTIENGTLVAASGAALGSGDVTVNGGELAENVSGQVYIGSSLTLSDNAALSLTIADDADIISVSGDAVLGGTLVITTEDGYELADNALIIESVDGSISGSFESVTLNGTDITQYITVTDSQVVYDADGDLAAAQNDSAAASPETGDEGFAIWICLVAFALMGLAQILLRRRFN